MTPVSTPGPAAPSTPPFTPPFNNMSRHFISPQRIEANRRNAQKSTGPRTEEGKKNSRLNGSRHYLTGQVRILPDEERKAVEGFCNPLIDRLAPVGGEEAQLARAIAEAHWRLARARAIEDNLFAIHIGTRKDSDIAGDNFQIADAFHIASAFAEQTTVFDRLTLYEQRIHRGRDRDEKKLQALQQVRLAAEAKAFEEAKLLLLFARQQKEEFDLEGEAKANGGFGFSIDRIHASISRDYRLKMARQASSDRPQFSKAA